MPQLINVNAWKVKTAAQKKKIQAKATAYVQSQTRKVLMEALKVSPQWSGNYAVNWALETSRTGAVSYTGKYKVDPWQALRGHEKQAGSREAIAYNLHYYNEETIAAIHWNSNIKLVNRAPVHELIESGQVRLRPENLIPDGLGVIAHLKANFKFIK